ncbi:MAG: universal stress protein [Gammaproteobacteria bacterium]|nr:universal stress protein [Gammaproteobacteria bacterium]
MSGRDKILVVVDPTAAEQPAVARGASLADAFGCDLELLICQHDPRFAGSRLFGGEEREAVRRAQLNHQLGYLKSLARDLDSEQITVSIKVVWDAPLQEAIVREVLRSEPRFLLKDTHHHSALSRSLFTNTDWHLIRDCPVPLWLVKPEEISFPTILAAVDPMHEFEKPASLDDAILDLAGQLKESLHGRLHVYHGYDTTPDIARAGAFAMAPSPLPVEDIDNRVRRAHEEAFANLVKDRGYEQAQIHVLSGSPAELLPALARKLGAGLVVMGSVARSRLKHAAVGSTAERVLDHLPCDVLIIKPPAFESPVTYHAQAGDFMELTA